MSKLHSIARMRLRGRRRQPLTGDEALWARLENERSVRWPLPMLMAQFAIAATLPVVVLIDTSRPSVPFQADLMTAILLALIAAAVAGGALCWFSLPRLSRHLDQVVMPRVLQVRSYITASEIHRRNRRIKNTLLTLGGAGTLALTIATALEPAEFWPIVIAVATFASAVTFFYGLRGRRGRDPSCARYGYPAGDEPSEWRTCSECGADLSKPMAVILGRDVRRPHLIVVGAVGYAAATAGFILL